MPVLVSVIIPAHNEEAHIAQTLDSILAQTYKHFEIIVVNDGSKDRTVEIVASYQKKFKNIKLLSFETGHSAAFARNNGVKCAKGAIVVFQDADCIADKEVLTIVVQQISKGYNGVAARTLFVPPKTLIARAIAVQRSLRWETHEETEKEITFTSGILVANMEKKCFLSLGGFNEHIYYFEDEDLTRRFFEKGYTAVYAAKAKEFHHDPDTLKETIQQSKSFGKGIAWLLRRNKGHARLILPLYATVALAALLLSFWQPLLLFLLVPLLALFLLLVIKSRDVLGAAVFVGLFVVRNFVKLAAVLTQLIKK